MGAPRRPRALVALRKLRGFDSLIKKLSGVVNERAVRLVYLGSAVRVDERQFPVLHQLLADVAAVLDAPSLPKLYVAANPVPAAITIGMDKPLIVVSSGMVDLLDAEEMRFVLGHEMGHVGSGHAVYQTLAQGTEYASAGDLRDSVLKLLLVGAQSHPFAVVRGSELRRWVDSGEYTKVLAGEYPRRTDDAAADLNQAAHEAARSYTETFRQNQDVMAKLVRDASTMLGSVRDWFGKGFNTGKEA